MSAQFGRCYFDGRRVDPEYLEKAGRMLAPYGPDGEGTYIKDSAGILFRAFHTTKEARREKQPHVTRTGAVLTWDGRLDNRPELIRELADTLTASATDVEIVAAAYEEWETGCFGKLLGDWALAVWSPSERSLVLAKDFVGTRHLFYSFDRDEVTWSTILDPLVLLAGKTFTLEEEYIAGWLAFFPATHLTPYVGIHAVPPSCFARITPQGQSIHKHWDFDPRKIIRYRTDGEYEEHFRQVFGESVKRRLRSDSPILAELSGGMDSSSIVCMADEILARGGAETPRLDTVSYYNDSEPNWNEKPYFTKVEEKRGREGWHIDVDSKECPQAEPDETGVVLIPGSLGSFTHAERQFASCVTSQGNRVVLSGVGGDEVMGGVPTPIPELEDLLAKGQFRLLAHQLKLWALDKRRPWFHLCFEAGRGFLPLGLVLVQKHARPTPWLHLGFVQRNISALRGYPCRLKILGPRPSFQESLCTLNALQRQLACNLPRLKPPVEKRYPYLDRDMLEFLYAVPREQLVRPSQRRSLMRRALVGIVPNALLHRRRKAFLARTPMAAVAESCRVSDLSRGMVSRLVGIVDSAALGEAMLEAGKNPEASVVGLARTLCIESWLRRLTRSSSLTLPDHEGSNRPSHVSGTNCPAMRSLHNLPTPRELSIRNEVASAHESSSRANRNWRFGPTRPNANASKTH